MEGRGRRAFLAGLASTTTLASAGCLDRLASWDIVWEESFPEVGTYEYAVDLPAGTAVRLRSEWDPHALVEFAMVNPAGDLVMSTAGHNHTHAELIGGTYRLYFLWRSYWTGAGQQTTYPAGNTDHHLEVSTSRFADADDRVTSLPSWAAGYAERVNNRRTWYDRIAHEFYEQGLFLRWLADELDHSLDTSVIGAHEYSFEQVLEAEIANYLDALIDTVVGAMFSALRLKFGVIADLAENEVRRSIRAAVQNRLSVEVTNVSAVTASSVTFAVTVSITDAITVGRWESPEVHIAVPLSVRATVARSLPIRLDRSRQPGVSLAGSVTVDEV